MKRIKTIYWVSTVMAMLTGALSAFFYFNVPFMIEGFRRLGFPDYFRIELGIAKIIGAIVLLLPQAPVKAKEWAYAAFAIVFISGGLVHGIVDGVLQGLSPVIPLTFLLIFYRYFFKWNKLKGLPNGGN